jgi:hypothetical protein
MNKEIVLASPNHDAHTLSTRGQGVTDDALMGAQLTEQYHRATGGMREVLRFGAMMMILRQRTDSARGICEPGTALPRGKDVKGAGIKGWLDVHAPEVTQSTAYRFENIAKSVQDQFALPAKVRKSLGFAGLATADADKLTDKERKLQQDLFAFIDGTSQRSWLDGFKEKKKLKGGDTSAHKKVADPEDAAEIASTLLYEPLLKISADWHSAQGEAPLWTHLPDAKRRELDGLLIEMRKGLLPHQPSSSKPQVEAKPRKEVTK